VPAGPDGPAEDDRPEEAAAAGDGAPPAPTPTPEPAAAPEPPAQETEDVPALAAIPRATPRPQAPRPAPAAPLRRPATARPAKAPPRRPAAPAARRAGAGAEPGSGRMALFAVVAVLVIALGAFGAMQIFGGEDGGGQAAAPNVTTDPQQTPDAAGGGGDAAAARPETVVVVLNGTPVSGLASDKRDELVDAGYSEDEGMIRTANNTDQTRQDSVVLYADGQRRQARDVASVLGIESSTDPADTETQSLADSTDVSGELEAEVVVVLGADQTP
jgi:hypothetical protein